MKTLIVYYSMSGNCEMVADRIAGMTGADVLRIEPEKAYPDKGARKFLWGGKSAVMGETPELKPYPDHVSEYDHVILGFPVWAGNVAPPIRTFVKEHSGDLKKMTVSAFACQSGSGAEKALKKLKELLAIDDLSAEMILIDPKTKENTENEERIKKFCDRIGEL